MGKKDSRILAKKKNSQAGLDFRQKRAPGQANLLKHLRVIPDMKYACKEINKVAIFVHIKVIFQLTTSITGIQIKCKFHWSIILCLPLG